MRKFVKNSILEIFQTMYEAHVSIKKMIDKKDFENVSVLLEDCQNTAVQIGTSIESSEGEGFVTVGYLEEYCEAVYEVATSISDDYSGNKAQKTLDKKLIKAENSVKNDVKVRLEIVFCPYKASMWDSLESVWKAADEDPDCDAYVVPIPYYDRNPDYSFGEFHYEGGDYPDYVPITHYEAYNFEARRPDVVYIHNPYDDCNYVTSVDPRFYSRELKKYTDELIYIPYFVLAEPSRDDPIAVEGVTHFAVTPGVINADKVIVQSEAMKQTYIKALLNKFGDTTENALCYGEIYYFTDVMSVYRYMHEGSWCLSYSESINKRVIHNSVMVEFLKKYDYYSNHSFTSYINKRIYQYLYDTVEIMKSYDNASEVITKDDPGVHCCLPTDLIRICKWFSGSYRFSEEELKMISSYKNICVMGNGKYSKIVIKILKENGIETYDIIVSEKNDRDDGVFTLSEYPGNHNQTLVIVSISQLHEDNIRRSLHNEGYTNLFTPLWFDIRC